MFQFRNLYGAAGAILGLVGLYLLLNNGGRTVQLIGALRGWTTETLETLQGR